MVLTMLRPSRTVVTSFTPRRTAASETVYGNADKDAYEQGDWVLCVARSDTTVSCALSNGQVQVYDKERLHQAHCFEAAVPGSIVNDVQYGPDGTVLLAASDDGSLMVWDIRQQQQQGSAVWKAKAPSSASLESLSVGYSGTLVAAGSGKGKIHFFDLRQQGQLLGSYVDSHTDVVSQVHFASMSSSVLLSGSEDGLAYCFDTRQPTEDLAVQSVLNVGTPLRRVGFCGDTTTPDGVPTTIFCLTGSETASLWDWGSSRRLQDFGGVELRPRLTQTLQSEPAAMLSGPAALSFSVDYLVDAHWDAYSRSLVLATGNVSGEGALFRLSSAAPDRWELCHLLRGGHRGVIRAWCPLTTPSSTSVLSISAGEDARLVEWNHHQELHQPSLPDPIRAPLRMTASRTTTTTTGVRAGGPIRRQPKRQKVSASPYA